jgi:hypothetical protein
MKAPRAGDVRDLPDNPSPVTAGPNIQARRRQQMERFSILAAGGCALPIEIVAALPICCEAVLSDDGSRVIGINFFGVEASGDAEGDTAWGEFLAEDAVRYAREHPGSEILTGILSWMGAALHFEDRGPGPLENGFVYRILRDYPDAVERVIARSISGALSGGSLRIRGGEADAVARHDAVID